MGNPKKDHKIIHTPNIQEVLNANKKELTLVNGKRRERQMRN